MNHEEIKKFDGKNVLLAYHKSGETKWYSGQLRLKGAKKKMLCMYFGELCFFRARLIFESEFAAVMKIAEIK